MLQALRKKRVVRKDLVTLANLSRRAHLPENSVAILHHLVRPSAHTPMHATDAEKAEYAAALNALGATGEAEQLLAQVNMKQYPNALLFRAYTHIWQWDWEGAIPFLRQYIGHTKINQEMRLWGTLSLAQCLMHSDLDLPGAQKLFEEICRQITIEQLLRNNALLGLMQAQILGKKWPLVRPTIQAIEQNITQDCDPYFERVFEQWKCLYDLFFAQESGKGLREAQGRLRKVRMKFKESKSFENVRSCDFYEAVCFKNEKLLTQLYFGTNFPAFRARILAALGGEDKLPANYQWSFFTSPQKGSVIVDLQSGRNSIGQAWLKEGQIPQRLLLVLGSDFYRPKRVFELHELLFPKEFYHPTSSPNRIHQALRRLRHWLAQNHIPLMIKEETGFYSLERTEACVIRLERNVAGTPLKNKLKQQLSILKGHFKTRLLSAVELPAVLGVSHRSSIRILNELRDHGIIERLDQGPQTQYRLLEAAVLAALGA